MTNLIKKLEHELLLLSQTNLDPTEVDVVEIRSVGKKATTLTIEFDEDTTGFQPTSLLDNNDSLEAFYSAFTVCLQKLEVDTDTTNSVSSSLVIDTTHQYQIIIDGTMKTLYGDALIDYLNDQPNIQIYTKS